MKKRTQYNGILLLVVLILITVTLVSIFGLIEKLISRNNGSPESPNYTDSGDSRVYYDDSWYTPKKSLKTLLVLGIDSITAPDGSKGDSAQADFIALVVIDDADKSFRVIHINRDTMTDIEQLDKHGNRYGIYEAQLALAHAYGGTDKIRCRNTVRAVENLLYGVDIDHYLSITMDAVPLINDALGGVTVTLEEDYTELGEEYVKGAEILLKGDDALRFVRARGSMADSSNTARMVRQRSYINALSKCYTELNEDAAIDTAMKVSEYFVSDCTVNQLSDLLERVQEYTYDGIFAVSGEAVMGSEHMEFYADDDTLVQMVIDLFYNREV